VSSGERKRPGERTKVRTGGGEKRKNKNTKEGIGGHYLL